MSVACGNKVHSPEALEALGVRQHHHETVAQVKLCFAGRSILSIEEQGLLDHQEQESRSELAAEKATERFFEERGGGTYAGSEEEARDRFYDSLNWEAAVATAQPGQSPEGLYGTGGEKYEAWKAEEGPESLTGEALLQWRRTHSLEKAPSASRRLHTKTETCNCPREYPQCHLYWKSLETSPAEVETESERLDRQSVEAEERHYRSVGNSPNYLLPADWKDGVYTIETEKGHRTFRFRTQDASSTFKPGVQIVSYLSGPDNNFANGNYTQFGEVVMDHGSRKTKVWVKHQKNEDLARDYLALLADPAAAMAAVHCYRCRALLTVPESVQSGWGRDCRKLGLR